MMTHDRFSAITSLLRGRAGRATAAARLVLCEGMPNAQAAREIGITPPAVWRLVARITDIADHGCPCCGAQVTP